MRYAELINGDSRNWTDARRADGDPAIKRSNFSRLLYRPFSNLDQPKAWLRTPHNYQHPRPESRREEIDYISNHLKWNFKVAIPLHVDFNLGDKRSGREKTLLAVVGGQLLKKGI